MTHEQLKCLMVAQLVAPMMYNFFTSFPTTDIGNDVFNNGVSPYTIKIFEKTVENIIQTINEKGKED